MHTLCVLQCSVARDLDSQTNGLNFTKILGLRPLEVHHPVAQIPGFGLRISLIGSPLDANSCVE